MAFDPAAAGWKQTTPEGIEEILGPFWIKRADSGYRLGFIGDAKHRNRNGVIHGGMLMTFIDNVLGAMAWDAGGRQPCATMQLDTHFVSAAQVGEFVEASGEVVRCARSVIFMRGALRVGDRDVVTANGIWKRLGAQ